MKLYLNKILLLFSLLLLCSVKNISAQNNADKRRIFPVRGFHLDLRIQVMKIPALKNLALKLQKDGFNTLIMEYEATYPYEKHPLIANRYAYTKAEITDFVKFCTGLGIDVIPLQQSFGHVEYVLRNSRYAQQREDQEDISQICPSKEELNRALFTDLFTELAATHPSKYIHIGGDETHLLGHCPICKAKVEKEGVSKLYADHIKLMCDIVIKLGKIPVVWADIALKYPNALKYLPKQVVFVDWNYGWDLNNFGDHTRLMKSGFEIWGAPSLRSAPDNYNLTQWEKHFNNIRNFVPQGRKLGYQGMVLTSWSTSGVYNRVAESSSDLVDLVPVRRVYPLTGFNILINAFAESLKTTEPLKIEELIVNYCKNNYGFDRSKALNFWNALKATPYEVGNGKVIGPISLKQLLDSTEIATKTIRSLKPEKNKDEYEQYNLMSAIRLQYLKYQYLEAQANAKTFTAAQVPAIAKQLFNVLKATKKINQQFIALNKASYYTSELAQENQLHIVKMQLLYNRLSKSR